MTRNNSCPFVQIDKVDQIFQTKGSDPVVALKDINFCIDREEFLTIVGPSGCGKSTLLFIIAQLMECSSGAAHLNYLAVDDERTSKFGIVFQRPVLLPWANILDNILFPLELIGRKITDADRRHALSLMKLAGIEGVEQRLPYQLSGGMQQRVSICRALITNPALLLMDEPFSAVDALTREKLVVDLQNIWAEEKITIVFVTHSIEEAVALGDRVIVLAPRPGRVVWEEKIDLPRPRGRRARSKPEFQEYSAMIYEKLGF